MKLSRSEKQAIKRAIQWGEKISQEFVFDANLYLRGQTGPGQERAHKKYKKIMDTIKILESILQRPDQLDLFAKTEAKIK